MILYKYKSDGIFGDDFSLKIVWYRVDYGSTGSRELVGKKKTWYLADDIGRDYVIFP